MFTGSFVALTTPFKDGKFDKGAFEKIVSWHLEEGTHGLVPCGTTGETPVLSLDEYASIISTCSKLSAGKIPVIAGAGANDTNKAIKLAKTAEENGADALLIVSPYYNKPTQAGLLAHYGKIADNCDLPIILYNVPARTGGTIEVETVIELANRYENIIGIKDATSDLTRPIAIRRALGESFCLLSGEDATIGAYLGQGGDGCISVSANVAPKLCASLHEAWQNGDIEKFSEIRDMLLPLHEAMFLETSPAPAKYALSKLGFCQNELRLPLVSISDKAERKIDNILNELGILSKKAA